MSPGATAEVLAFFGSLAFGAVIARQLLARSGLDPVDLRLLSLASAPGLAAGASSIAYCAKAALGGTPAGLRSQVAVAVAAVLGAAILRRGDSGTAATPGSARFRLPSTRRGTAAAALTLLAVAASLGLLFESLFRSGYGGWDAHAWWNHLARVLTRGYQDLPEGFVNTNYPLLLPGWTASLWTVAGSDSALTPQLCAASWTIGIALYLVAGLSHDARTANLTVAAIFLTSAPVIHQTTEQYADLPVAYFLVATATLFARIDRGPTTRGLAIVAGAGLGLLAWTKNEGGIWALLLFVCWLIARGRAGLAGMRFSGLALGAAPGVLALVLYKLNWASEWGSQSVAQMLEGDSASRFAALSRWLLPTDALTRALLPDISPGGWGFTVPFVLVVLALRIRPADPSTNRIERTLLLFLGAFLACLLGIYVLTPKPQDWHLSSSFGRLFLQAVPIGLLTAGSVLGRWVSTSDRIADPELHSTGELSGTAQPPGAQVS